MKKQYLHIVQHANLFLLAAMLLCSGSIKAQYVKRYNQLSIYVIAHQDDWQLFMGSNVYNDIQAFDEITPDINGKKVVIIYTTAGNLNEDDDTKSCNCRDPFDTKNLPFPYWKVREVGSKRSLHLAATRKGGWGAVYPYPENKTVNIGGHDITRYEYKNTVSYYLRLKAGAYSNWYHTPNARVETVDGSATYADWADFVNTLYYIFKTEKDSSVLNNQVCIGYQDVNETTNPNDHHDHYIAGRASSEAAKLLGKELDTCLSQTLFVDYNSQNLPLNLVSPDIQNEAALTSVYCLALLDYNAWPEWGSIYQDWTSRNYSRTITCENPTSNDLLAKAS